MSDDQFATCEAEMARRNPYGVPPDAKTGALFELGHTAQDAVQNLLNKGIDRLERGDVDGVERFISRAAALPFDQHERIRLGPMMAGHALHGLLCDFIEDWADAQAYPEDHESICWLQ